MFWFYFAPWICILLRIRNLGVKMLWILSTVVITWGSFHNRAWKAPLPLRPLELRQCSVWGGKEHVPVSLISSLSRNRCCNRCGQHNPANITIFHLIYFIFYNIIIYIEKRKLKNRKDDFKNEVMTLISEHKTLHCAL